LLESAGIAFRVIAPEGQEPAVVAQAAGPGIRVRYADLVRRAALAKAKSAAGRASGLLLGADTIVVCDGQVLGKPTGPADARRTLRRLSGRWHSVYTGLALLSEGRYMLGYERTKVCFRALSKNEIGWYVGTGEPMDKAGAYAIQGRGAACVRAIRGCYTNVIGLPLPKLMEMLADFKRGARTRCGARRGAC
jgi:septum formation protein